MAERLTFRQILEEKGIETAEALTGTVTGAKKTLDLTQLLIIVAIVAVVLFILFTVRRD